MAINIEDRDGDMPSIKQINVAGTTYAIKDAAARSELSAVDIRVTQNTNDILANAGDIADLKESVRGGVHYLGKTISELSDGASPDEVSVLISASAAVVYYKSGEETELHKVLKSGDMVIEDNAHSEVDSIEFIWNGLAWNKLGSTKGLGNLAFKNSAQASYIPAGSVDVSQAPAQTCNLSADFVGTAVTPTGLFTGSEGDISVTGKAAGTVLIADPTVTTLTVATGTATVLNEVLTISFGNAVLSLSVNMNGATFTGNDSTSTGKFTPTGLISISPVTPVGTVTGTTTVNAHSHAATFDGTLSTIVVE